VRAAYPTARIVDSPPPNPLVYSAIVLRASGHDRIWFMLDHRGGHVTSIELPAPQFCE
jgi:hypothetical protein